MNILPNAAPDGTVFSENEYFTKKLENGKFLVTTRHGSWLMLAPEEYELLCRRLFFEDSSFFKKLEDKGIILTEKNVRKVIGEYAKHFLFEMPANILCCLNLTNRCNLHCTYCHARACQKDAVGEDADEDIIKTIISFISSLPQKYTSLEFQGGEPLLRLDLIKFFINHFRASTDKKISKLMVVSNFTLMDEDIAEYLIKNDFRVGTSFDGPRELHNMQRKYITGAGSYDDVAPWIRYFLKKRLIVGATQTITKNSLAFGAKAIIDECLDIGLDAVLFRPIYNIGRAKESNLKVDAADFFKFYVKGIEYIYSLSKQNITVTEIHLKHLLENIFSPYRGYMCIRNPCGAVLTQMSFTPKGDIFPCDTMRSMPELKLGNVSKDTSTDIFFKSLQYRERAPEFLPLCDTCVYSSFCVACASRAHSENRSIIPVTPKDTYCNIHHMIFDYVFEKMHDEGYRNFFIKMANVKDIHAPDDKNFCNRCIASL